MLQVRDVGHLRFADRQRRLLRDHRVQLLDVLSFSMSAAVGAAMVIIENPP